MRARLLVALGFALFSLDTALGQAAPTLIASDTATVFGTGITASGGCSAGQVGFATVYAGSSRTVNALADSVGNTWTGGTAAVQGTNNLRSFRSVLGVNIVGASTTLTVTLSGAAGAVPLTSVYCLPSGTAFDTEGRDNGGVSATTLTTTTGAVTNASQVMLTIFMSGSWNIATPQPPTGWNLAGTTLLTNFGLKTYYASAGAGASPAATLNGMSPITWMASWGALNYSAATSAAGHLALMKVGR